MASASNVKQVGYHDCPGGGQVWVSGTTAYIGHMSHPHGTSVVDVSDPTRPRTLAEIEIPAGFHSHKVRVANDIMLVNHEAVGGGTSDLRGGLGIYDVSEPARPRLVTNWETAGKGVHRYSFDGRYAYISPTVEGYVGNIVMILDLADPARPEEVGRWWIPGQWEAGGEEYPWGDGVAPRCHHPLRLGDRLYASYWHHGFYILDIDDMSRPRFVSGLNTSPLYPHPAHTALPIPETLHGRRIVVVADEDVAKLREHAPAFAWILDVTIEESPTPIATFQVEGLDLGGAPQPPFTGCHQPAERFEGTEVPFAWFTQGLRLVDISDPYHPRETGHFLPDPPDGFDRLCSNDVTVDDRGLLYLIDRQRGLHIVERK